jgi:hypothetical protein
MSYILDALKKSEQERAQKAEQQECAGSKNQTQPPVQVQPQRDDVQRSESSWLIKFVYLILVVLSGLVLMKIFEVPSESVYVSENQSSQDSSIINNQGVTNTAINDAVLNQADIKAPAIAIEQAPKVILSQLPIMNISSHIYSTQANRRSIVVNDQRLVEGDFVSPGVQVQQITNQGMIVQAQGWLLVVNRSRGWGL